MSTADAFFLQRRQAFGRDALRRGLPLVLAYAGPWTRSPVDGSAAQAPLPDGTPASSACRGFLGLAPVTNLFLLERLKKWGAAFEPDAACLFPQALPVARLTSVTDARSGQGYDVCAVPPETMLETVCRCVFLRLGAVFPRRVSVVVEDDQTDADLTLFTNLPCRLTPLAGEGGGMTDTLDQTVSLSTTSLILECPNVVQGAGVLGTGVFPGYNAGDAVTLYPGNFLTDDPSTYGGTGPVRRYKVDSPLMDPGGDFGHHQRYLVSLQPS